MSAVPTYYESSTLARTIKDSTARRPAAPGRPHYQIASLPPSDERQVLPLPLASDPLLQHPLPGQSEIPHSALIQQRSFPYALPPAPYDLLALLPHLPPQPNVNDIMFASNKSPRDYAKSVPPPMPQIKPKPLRRTNSSPPMHVLPALKAKLQQEINKAERGIMNARVTSPFDRSEQYCRRLGVPLMDMTLEDAKKLLAQIQST
jgi:hypothetical protein